MGYPTTKDIQNEGEMFSLSSCMIELSMQGLTLLNNYEFLIVFWSCVGFHLQIKREYTISMVKKMTDWGFKYYWEEYVLVQLA